MIAAQLVARHNASMECARSTFFTVFAMTEKLG